MIDVTCQSPHSPNCRDLRSKEHAQPSLATTSAGSPSSSTPAAPSAAPSSSRSATSLSRAVPSSLLGRSRRRSQRPSCTTGRGSRRRRSLRCLCRERRPRPAACAEWRAVSSIWLSCECFSLLGSMAQMARRLVARGETSTFVPACPAASLHVPRRHHFLTATLPQLLPVLCPIEPVSYPSTSASTECISSRLRPSRFPHALRLQQRWLIFLIYFPSPRTLASTTASLPISSVFFRLNPVELSTSTRRSSSILPQLLAQPRPSERSRSSADANAEQYNVDDGRSMGWSICLGRAIIYDELVVSSLRVRDRRRRKCWKVGVDTGSSISSSSWRRG
jgi:hypothetical protein